MWLLSPYRRHLKVITKRDSSQNSKYIYKCVQSLFPLWLWYFIHNLICGLLCFDFFVCIHWAVTNIWCKFYVERKLHPERFVGCSMLRKKINIDTFLFNKKLISLFYFDKYIEFNLELVQENLTEWMLLLLHNPYLLFIK